MSASPPTNCAHCGANLGAADLQHPSCPYCGTVHPHVAAAAQKVEVIKQLMAQGPGGVPAIFSGVPGPTPPMTGYPMGAAPPPGAPPPGVPVWSGQMMISSGGAIVPQGGAPPLTGGPVGGGTPYMVDPYRAERGMRNIGLIITLAVFGVFAVVGVAIAILFVVAR